MLEPYSHTGLPPFSGSAWKQVDAEHADLVESGSLLIGRVQDYADLENGRTDALDSAIEIRQGSGILQWSNPMDRPAMQKLGMEGVGTAFGTRVRGGLRPTYALCMSEVGCTHDPSPAKPKATFEVLDVHDLAVAIIEAHADKFSHCMYGKVIYRKRIYYVSDEMMVGPSAFEKSPHFRAEREIRISFDAAGLSFEPFVTGANPKIAALLNRVA